MVATSMGEDVQAPGLKSGGPVIHAIDGSPELSSSQRQLGLSWRLACRRLNTGRPPGRSCSAGQTLPAQSAGRR